VRLVGLTGSIAMGKSATALMFRRLGHPVFDADAAVHALYERGGAAVEPVGRLFSGTVAEGAIDRARLSEQVGSDPAALARLEAVVHPLVRQCERRFLEAARKRGAPFAVLDIPLLFETGGASRLGSVVVVSAPSELQRARALARPGMTEQKFAAIMARQMPDSEKRRLADYLIRTGEGLESAFEQVRAVADDILRGG
jgi:dephospho-CoA kinase